MHPPGTSAGRSISRKLIPLWILLWLLPAAQPVLSQPPDSSRFRQPDLVELTQLDSTIRLDIRYATPNNFMKRKMYTEARAFLQRPAAEALVRVQRKLRKEGFSLIIFDGYRPWSVTKEFWDWTPAEKRKFVANPAQGSKHNRGCAVDLSLYDLKTGNEVLMPSPFDDFTAKAAADFHGGKRSQRRMRNHLRRVMESEGFTVNPVEWWHFDYKDWREYRVLNVPFEEIR